MKNKNIKLIFFVSIIVGLLMFYYFSPFTNRTIETKIKTPDIEMEALTKYDKDTMCFLYYKNILYFDELEDSVLYESFIALDTNEIPFAIKEKDLEVAKAIRHYRGWNIINADNKELITDVHFKKGITKIEFVIPKDKLRFEYLDIK